MNADNVRLWVEDLESGRHPQARGSLCRLDEDSGEVVGYCCLGRACEVALAHGLPLKVEREGPCRMYNYSDNLLPDAAKEWLGVGVTDLRGSSPGTFYGDLIAMNDNGSTFPEIAQYIREHVTGL